MPDNRSQDTDKHVYSAAYLKAHPWKATHAGRPFGRYKTASAARNDIYKVFPTGHAGLRHAVTGEIWERRGGPWCKVAPGRGAR